MFFKHVKIGDRLEIYEENKKDIVYASQVEEVKEKRALVIHMPISFGQYIKLKEKNKYTVIFFTDSGLLRYEAVIEKHKVEDGFNLTEIKLNSNGERMQRREFFRFTCLIPTKFSVQEKKGTADNNNVITFEGIIKDIGGGGLRFVSNEVLEEGEKIKAAIVLNTEVIIVNGKILHKQFFPKSNYKYQYRVEFIGILKTEQEVIVQFIFEQQRKILQKTKI